MTDRILITGSCGLVGSALTTALLAQGNEVALLDLRACGQARGDVRDQAQVHKAVEGVSGIIHLAAVSRVVWGERAPLCCRATNIGGLRNVLNAVLQSARKPWLIFASSREVYGQADSLPASEDSPLLPVNVYGRSKVEGESLLAEAQRAGIRACTIRLSNVFGSTSDHADRVIPAFIRAASIGSELLVEGPDHTFDFTHLDDVTRGILSVVDFMVRGSGSLPPIQFVSGRPTSLAELASLAVQLSKSDSAIRNASPRAFGVARFFGDPSRAKALLGWQAKVRLEDGLIRLIHAFHGVQRKDER